MAPKLIRVGLGECGVTRAPGRLIGYGLGSCIALSLYDGEERAGAMAHIMLPSMARAADLSNPFKFADTAVYEMVALLRDFNCLPERLCAKMAGGAAMFANLHSSVGERNAAAVRRAAAALRIPLVGEDTGGDYGRTVVFDAATGDMLVKTMHSGERIL